nr:MAG TPA: hypothetical protein [Caudoviricetes sp.]
MHQILLDHRKHFLHHCVGDNLFYSTHVHSRLRSNSLNLLQAHPVYHSY